MDTKGTITIQAVINAPVEKVWKFYNEPNHIVQWNSPSNDWHTPKAQNDLKVGGKFVYRMEAKDGSAGFDFEGIYTQMEAHKLIAYSMPDGRRVNAVFTQEGANTKVTVTFDPENEKPIEMQRAGWQAILDNFKKYAESSK